MRSPSGDTGTLPATNGNQPHRTALRGHRFGEKDFEVLGLLRFLEGRTITDAAQATGFSVHVVYDWFGRNPHKHDELKRRMKLVYLARVQELGELNTDWRAYAWMLERMFPNEFALREVHRMEHSGSSCCATGR